MLDPSMAEIFVPGGSDPDDLAVTEAARLVQAGRRALIALTLDAEGRTVGFRVCAADDEASGRFFPCHPMTLPKSVRDRMAQDMYREAVSARPSV